MNHDALQAVIRRHDTWLGREERFALAGAPANSDHHRQDTLATGFSALDGTLAHGGWPLGSTVELLSDANGLGAMGLFLPAMERLGSRGRWQVFIAPPCTPYAPLLAARGIDTQQVLLVHPRSREDLLWSTEQALRSPTCSAVFSWLGASDYRYAELRKLQLAAAAGDSLSVLFRANPAAGQHAPAPLRLQLPAYRQVHILKQRGGRQGVEVCLPASDDVPGQPQLWELPALTPAAQHGVATPVA